MPLYLCLPGQDQPEPWRHGMSVYAAPFAQQPQSTLTTNHNNNDSNSDRPNKEAGTTGGGNSTTTPNDATTTAPTTVDNPAPNHNRRPLRRLRHGEVVLVDDVCVAYEAFWLRLRWPGRKAGFAGYLPVWDVAVVAPHRGEGEEAAKEPENTTATTSGPSGTTSPINRLSGQLLRVETEKKKNESTTLEDRGTDEADYLDDPAREETASMSAAEPAIGEASWMCLRTGLVFPTSAHLQCLSVYDDGVTPPVAIHPSTAEPVFCRICREGLHEDADDEQPEAENDEGGTDNRGGTVTPPAVVNRQRNRGLVATSRQTSDNEDVLDGGEEEEEDETEDLTSSLVVRQVDPNDPTIRLGQPPVEMDSKGPVLPHPIYSANPHAMENPIMAPCDCAGSMAFVHYLCVEEWRCRSRHPAARNGLNCETCGAAYRLPPPTSRPAHVLNPMDDEMMMDAMPAHVMQALRQPHIWWQIGASIVRRRWLRPLAPVLMSPIVSLYCRSRRMLKKRGVARRRWACSLCRRRARWKCVRCLRSYYCSRQCQNVSWHIVHKHLCYKPVRVVWSWIVYGSAAVLFCPGIVRDPLLYDLGMLFIPASFVVCSVLAGAFATLLKKSVGYDIRGRLLEVVVLLMTIWLSCMSWGLAQAFFGEAESCYGMLGPMTSTSEMHERVWVLQLVKHFVLEPTRWYYALWDRAFANSSTWIQALVCSPDATGCFPHVPPTPVDFYLKDGSCASDWYFFLFLYVFAFGAFGASTLYKARERQLRQRHRDIQQDREMRLRRRAVAGLRGHAVRPHAD